MCGKPAREDRAARWEAKKRGWAYCSKTCASRYKAWSNSKVMAATNRKYASERMRTRNPMKREDVRLKLSQRLKEIGHQPRIRGGNGRPATATEALMAQLLGWDTQVIVRTGCTPVPGALYPTHYKIDVGHSGLKIAIEIDGSSHGLLKRKEQDRKKTRFLESLGWTVFRFSNKQVLENPLLCVQTVMSTISK